MKKIFLILLVLFVLTASSLFAFEKGTLGVGGSFSFSSSKSSADSPAYTSLGFRPALSYFVVDNLCLDLSPQLGISSRTYRTSNVYVGDSTEKVTHTTYGLGIGARYFYKMFYGGGGFYYNNSGDKYGRSGYKEVRLTLGRLFNIAKNVFLDVGMVYNLGVGKMTNAPYMNDEGVVMNGDIDNDRSSLSANVGLSVFFN